MAPDARLVSAKDRYVAVLDGRLREVTGDPPALRQAAEQVRRLGASAGLVGSTATGHADAAQTDWQGGAYEAMRGRVRGAATELAGAAEVLHSAARGYHEAAGALQTATTQVEQAKQAFTTTADDLIRRSDGLPEQQVRPLIQLMEQAGRQADTAAQRAAQQADRVLGTIANTVRPGQTARVGSHGGQRYVVYPNGEVRVGGDRAWRNNNPGNLEYGPRAQRFGAIGADPRFAIFPDAESGENAMRDLLRNRYGDRTIAQMIPSYAPGHENNIPAYVAAIARGSGVDVSTRTISSFTDAEFTAVVRAMIQHEGNRAGQIYTRDNAPDWVRNLLGP